MIALLVIHCSFKCLPFFNDPQIEVSNIVYLSVIGLGLSK